MIKVDTFIIDETIARELSELLIKETIRKDLLVQNIDNREVFDKIERELISVVEKINVIKNKITNEYIPDKYRSDKYVWNYEGWAISKNQVEIMEV